VTVKSPALFLALVLLVFGCGDVFAGKPDSHSLGYYDLLDVVNCGDFSVMDDVRVVANISDHFDADGNIERSHIHLVARDDFYRDDDPGGSHVTGKARISERVSFDEAGNPLWAPVEIFVTVRVSGVGVLLLDVGALEVELDGDWNFEFSGDRFSDWAAADFEALCAHFE
jgi:hypothetical protein